MTAAIFEFLFVLAGIYLAYMSGYGKGWDDGRDGYNPITNPRR